MWVFPYLSPFKAVRKKRGQQGQSVAVQAAQAVAAAVANAPPVPPATTPVQSNAPAAAAFVGTSVAWYIWWR